MVSVFELIPFAFTRWFVPISFVIGLVVLIYILRPERKVIENSILAGFSLSIFNFVWETTNVLRILSNGRELVGGYIGGFTLLWTGLESFPVFTFWGASFCLIMYALSRRRYSVAYIVPFFLGFTTLSAVGDYNMVQVGNAYIPGIELVDPLIWIVWFGFFMILDMLFWIWNTRSRKMGHQI